MRRTVQDLAGRLEQSDWRAGRNFRFPGFAGVAAILTLALAVGGCSDSFSLPKFDDINPFFKKDPPLPGKRMAIMDATGSVSSNLAPAEGPVVIPGQIPNDSWPQPGGNASNAPGHLALGATLRQAWSADAGTGSSKAGKVTASPIVYEGRVYTLDAAATVTAFATSGGASLWRSSLVPESERKAGSFWTLSGNNARGGYGGGIAADSGRLYVATGYGTVHALDPKTGKAIWSKDIRAPVRAAPTAAVDRVIVITTEGKVIALAGSDGSELWSAAGLPEQASLIASPSAAIDGDTVVAPFASGEMIGVKLATGQQAWTESLTRARTGSAMAAMSDAARPAIDRGVVFGLAHGGRMVAVQLATGERLWSIDFSGTQMPWVAGEMVFAVDSAGQLMAVNRRDGRTVWTMKLPGSNVWSGPTLAGGQLWLVSAKGALVGVDAATGRVTSQQGLGNPGFIAPVVAGGRMYILTDNARLIAFN
jgi:outer membrane protein assembly factor BamB